MSNLIFAIQPCAPQNITAENKYGIDQELIAGGWSKYIEDRVIPEIEWFEASGLKPRIIVHNPMMVRAGEMFQMDQWIHARNAGLVTTKDFSVWKTITARAEVIFYVGTLHGDIDFEKRKLPMKLDDHTRRLLDSISPFIDVGGSVGFDYSNDWPVDSFEYRELSLCRAMLNAHNGHAYIEPIANNACPHLYSWPSITQEGLWQVRADHWFPNLKQVTGEIIRWVDRVDWSGSVEAVASRMLPVFKSILSDSHTACGATNWFREWGMSAAEVVEA